MEQGGSQNGVGLSLQKGIGKMLHRTRAARRDHGNTRPLRHRGGQRQIIAGFGSVAVHAGQQDFPRPKRFRPGRPLERIQSGIQTSAVLIHIPSAAVLPPPGVNSHDDALAAEAFGRLGNQLRPVDGRGIDADFIGPLTENVMKILHRADTAPDRKGNGELLRDPGRQCGDIRAALMRGRDVEKHHLVRTLAGISGGDLNRVARIPQIDEVDTLDHPTVLDIQTGDDPFGVHQTAPPTILIKFFKSVCPTSPDFSGWN